MSADVTFVNKFMDSMRNKLNDFVGQVVMLETNNAIANERIDLLEAATKELEHSIELKDSDYALVVKEKEDLQFQVDEQLANIQKLERDVDNYINISNDAIAKLNDVRDQVKNEYQSQIQSLENELVSAKDTINRVQIEAENECQARIASLQSQFNTIQHELSVAKKIEANLVKDYQELLSTYETLQKENELLKTPVETPKPQKKINTK